MATNNWKQKSCSKIFRKKLTNAKLNLNFSVWKKVPDGNRLLSIKKYLLNAKLFASTQYTLFYIKIAQKPKPQPQK